ncbi:MAG TPA: hypothetical protein VLS89_01850 [Candidatus Nanopelagicales bacterium]|nr:hypothetical protein [Candidatus Nanopelagicales bacterium]
MTGKEALLERLRREAPGDKQTVQEYWERQTQEWIDDLQSLMETLAGWLDQAEQEGLLSVERQHVELAEEDLGPYDVPALAIHLRTTHPRIIRVHPRGLRIVGVIVAGDHRIVGARGRVDITCGAGRTMLLRFKDKDHETSWSVIQPDGTGVPLTEDGFSDVLNELTA